MFEEWLIDGYNLLRDASAQKGNVKLSREKLFGLLADFAAQGGRKVLMVLDGCGNDDEFEAYRTKVFNIVYSQFVTADAVIEKTLYERKNSGHFMVVTKDRAIIQIARGLGSRVTEPEEFMELLKDQRKETDQILFIEKIKSHGFNRPFEKIKPPIE